MSRWACILGGKLRFGDADGVAIGVRGPHGARAEKFTSFTRIALAVHRHVEAVAEDVLVHMRLDARRHERAIG